MRTFRLVERSDDVITSSGCGIRPFKVKSILLEHPAVVGVLDEMRTELVKAIIVLAKGYTGADALTKKPGIR